MTRTARRAQILLGAAALVLATALTAVAQEDGHVNVANRTSLQLSAGTLVYPASPLLELSLAHHFGDLVEIGVRQEGGFATGSGRDDWHLATTPFVDVALLRDPKWFLTPFVGLAAGALYDAHRVTATLGPEAGVELFLSDAILLAARYQFRWAAEPTGGVGRDSHMLLLGVGFLLGSDPAGDAAELARVEASAARAEEAAANAERAVERLEKAVDGLERAVDQFELWFKEQLRK